MQNENSKSEKEAETIFIQQAYLELMALIEQVPDLKMMTSQKTNIAWLIERMRQENPLDWQIKIREMAETVRKLNESGGKFEVSHFLNQEINNRYIVFLEKMLQQDDIDEKRKQNLEIMIKMTQDDSQFAEQAMAKNEAVSFGGVSLDYTPEWYYSLPK